MWEKFAEHGLDARHFGGVKIACVGPVTADAVRAFGIEPELVPAQEMTTEGLLAEFPPYDDLLDPVGRVLLPRADIATETLAAGLTELGWEVDDVTAYRTVRACGLPAMPTRLRTVEEDVNSTASNPPDLIASRISAGGGAARTVR